MAFGHDKARRCSSAEGGGLPPQQPQQGQGYPVQQVGDTMARDLVGLASLLEGSPTGNVEEGNCHIGDDSEKGRGQHLMRLGGANGSGSDSGCGGSQARWVRYPAIAGR